MQPKLNQRSKSVGRLRPTMNTSIFERLHSEAELNLEQVNKNEQIKDAKELEGCTHTVRADSYRRICAACHSLCLMCISAALYFGALAKCWPYAHSFERKYFRAALPTC
jgi:hypothetical protein